MLCLYLDLDMISSFRYYMKKEILYIDLTVVPYCQRNFIEKWIENPKSLLFPPPPPKKKKKKKKNESGLAQMTNDNDGKVHSLYMG